MIPPTSTRVPDILDALVDAAKQSVGGEDVTVFDGPALTQPMADCIEIGTRDADEESVIVDSSPLDGYGNAYEEIARVVCLVWSTSGGDDMQARRRRCGDIIGALDAHLREHQDLDGVCDKVRLGTSWSWSQIQHADGVTASVGFTIDCTSII